MQFRNIDLSQGMPAGIHYGDRAILYAYLRTEQLSAGWMQLNKISQHRLNRALRDAFQKIYLDPDTHAHFQITKAVR